MDIRFLTEKLRQVKEEFSVAKNKGLRIVGTPEFDDLRMRAKKYLNAGGTYTQGEYFVCSGLDFGDHDYFSEDESSRERRYTESCDRTILTLDSAIENLRYSISPPESEPSRNDTMMDKINSEYKPAYRNSWALIIGINEYKAAPPLSFACNDADSIHEAIKRLDFPSSQIIVLKDIDATKTRIMEEFINLHNKADHKDDRVLFFFAGHGCTVQGNRGQIGYLVPVDGDTKSLSSLIRWDDITRNAELISAKHILFIMDACYSGLAIQRTLPPGVKRFISDVLQRPARQVISAGMADQTVADGGGPSGKNSLFTGYLLEGLKGNAANSEGVLTANTLMSYLYDKVSQDPRSRQTPHWGHLEGDGDFVLLTPNKEHVKPDLAANYLVETKEEIPEPQSVSKPEPDRVSFAINRGYADPNHPSFGRNDLSAKLGECRVIDDRVIEKGFSWLGLLIEPLDKYPISIDILAKAKTAQVGGKFYVGGTEPYEKFNYPVQFRTTSDSLLTYSNSSGGTDHAYWGRYLRIYDRGCIEYADTVNTFIEYRGRRIFYWVRIIGITWQLMFLAKSLLLEAGYRSAIRLTFCLVGTRDTILGDFSQEPGIGRNKWRDPLLDVFALSHVGEKSECTDTNLKIEHDVVLANLDRDESLKLIKSIAQKIELAYNHHESPRCFNVDTDDFPWKQYTLYS